MSTSFIIRYEARPDAADENQRLIQSVFAELAQEQPPGLRYASFRLADGATFIHVAAMDEDAGGLNEVQAFKEFQQNLRDRVQAGTRTQTEATLIGFYGPAL